MASLLANFQGIRAKMQDVTESLKQKKAIGKAGGDFVTVEANGLGQILRVTLDPGLIADQDQELIEDLLPAAINAALTKAKELHAEALSEMSGMGDMPGLKDIINKIAGEQSP
ncbi:MAG: YbaB/EbfC family nucleoid-associated protein [Pirellulales bacterium]|nr:YbaB/EbfC family nucleoid-associated protein [Pirellulales bacterium]